ncbi:P-loop containing nucleoside triphosphate hydrolase protein, partial [Flagelloscypha sp. PMI_526]
MICGSGFGGLLAIMCGILHMTGDQLVEELVSLCKIVFSEDLDVCRRTALYEETLKSMVERFTEEGHNGRMLMDNNVVCKTFVCAASSHNVAHPRLFRNYQTRANASPDCPIWQAGRATTAIPDVFNPIVIGQELIGETFSSGELRWINPTDELTREASDAFDATRHIACIISIGSGHPQHLSLLDDKADIFRRMASDCEKIAEDLKRRFKHTCDVYQRINVQQGFQRLDRFDIATLEQVVSHTRDFLLSIQAIFNLDSLVQDLLQPPLRVPVDSACGVLPPTSNVVRLKHVPPPTPYFVGRESLLQRLDNYFFIEKDLCHIAVLYGLGGSGKTQGSLKFIQQSQEAGRFTEVFFVNASSQLTLEGDLKAIAASKSLGTSMDDAIHFLRNHKAEWLLFIDNADDPKLDLHPFVAWGHGNVLITTRNSEVRTHAPRCSLHIDNLEEDEAVSLLFLGVEVGARQDAQRIAEEIVKELGCLALAVNQARAFLAKGICNLEDYLRLYRDNHRTLLADKTVQSTDDYKYSVYTTWTISFNQLSEEAALFLRLLCFMHHRSIPFTLFKDAQCSLFEDADYYKDTLPALAEDFLLSFRNQSGWDALHFHQVVAEVLSFSLLQSDPTNQVFHLHPLVQKWMQDQS